MRLLQDDYRIYDFVGHDPSRSPHGNFFYRNPNVEQRYHVQTFCETIFVNAFFATSKVPEKATILGGITVLILTSAFA